MAKLRLTLHNTKNAVWLNQDFGWFFIGQSASRLGNSLHFIALMTLAYQATHSAIALGSMWLSFSLPVILVGPFIGTLLDRYLPVRTTMIVADLVRAILVLSISLIPFSYATFIPIYLALTVAELVFDSSREIVTPSLVPTEQLLRANGIMGAASSVIRLLGPALAGLLVVAFPLRLVFVIDALTFLISAYSITRMGSSCFTRRGKPSGEQEAREPFFVAFRHGLKALASSPVIVVIAAFMCLLDLTQGASNIMLLPLVDQYFTAWVYGYVLSSFALGSLLGNLVVQRLPESWQTKAFIASCVVTGLARVGFGTTSLVPVLLACAVLNTGAGAVFSLVMRTNMQKATPESNRGRVFSMVGAMQEAAFLLSTTVAGIIVYLVGTRMFFVLDGLVMLLGVFVPLATRVLAKQKSLTAYNAD